MSKPKRAFFTLVAAALLGGASVVSPPEAFCLHCKEDCGPDPDFCHSFAE